jgi:hypothetical protein
VTLNDKQNDGVGSGGMLGPARGWKLSKKAFEWEAIRWLSSAPQEFTRNKRNKKL